MTQICRFLFIYLFVCFKSYIPFYSEIRERFFAFSLNVFYFESLAPEFPQATLRYFFFFGALLNTLHNGAGSTEADRQSALISRR